MPADYADEASAPNENFSNFSWSIEAVPNLVNLVRLGRAEVGANVSAKCQRQGSGSRGANLLPWQ